MHRIIGHGIEMQVNMQKKFNSVTAITAVVGCMYMYQACCCLLLNTKQSLNLTDKIDGLIIYQWSDSVI